MEQINYYPRCFTLGILLALHVAAGEAQAQISSEGVRFSGIDVRGNTQSSDIEILALCQLASDARYNGDDLQAALDCLGNTGKFKTVSFDTEGDLLVINVAEVHQYNGLMDISASVDSDRGLSANLYLEKQNLFTEELSGSLSVELSKYDRYVGAFLVDENLLGLGL